MLSTSEVKYTKLFINNEWVDAVQGKTFPTYNPATGEKIVEVAEAQKDDIYLAVAAAKKAFEPSSAWRRLPASQRGVLMYKLADLIERDLKYIARLESLDNGKTVKDAINDVAMSAFTIRYYAGAADKVHGNTIPADGDVFSMTVKEPVGVCGQIVPWNFPFMMAAMKIAPVLATGCTMVLKAAEQTPLTALYLASLIKEAGIPAGVVNVVNGFGPTAGAPLSEHSDVNKVSFTGSTEVGKIIMGVAAKTNLKRVTLELGGKSPLVIFDDADLEKAVKLAHEALFINHGQTCCCGSRTFVQAGIYDKFVKRSAELASARRLGDPSDPKTDQGPQIDEEMMNKVLGYITSAKAEGARLVAGGGRYGQKGYFVEPTVFADVLDDMRIAREEIFGPVQSIFRFETFDEVVRRCNDTEYGLAAGVITQDINKALSFAKSVKAGTVWVNTFNYLTPQTPFGGFKQSGIGREFGKDALDAYLETKTITIDLPQQQ